MKAIKLLLIFAITLTQCKAHIVQHVIQETDKTIKDISRVVSGGLFGGIKVGFSGHASASSEGDLSAEPPRRPGLFGLSSLLHPQPQHQPPPHPPHGDHPYGSTGGQLEKGYSGNSQGDYRPGSQYGGQASGAYGHQHELNNQNGYQAGGNYNHHHHGHNPHQQYHNHHANNQNGYQSGGNCDYDDETENPHHGYHNPHQPYHNHQANNQNGYQYGGSYGHSHGGHNQGAHNFDQNQPGDQSQNAYPTTGASNPVNNHENPTQGPPRAPNPDVSGTKEPETNNNDNSDEFSIDVRMGFSEDQTKEEKKP